MIDDNAVTAANMPGSPDTERVDRKFRAAWEVFSLSCADAIAPEATFQAWFAHYLISQFGIDRVAREPIFKHRHFESSYRQFFAGGEIKLDAVVTRAPGIRLPHYVYRGEEGDGLLTIEDLAVVSELKVSSTQGGGLDHTEVCKDFWKLSMLLEESDTRGYLTPLAYVCILDNHPTKRYNVDWLVNHRLVAEPYDKRIRMLHFSLHDVNQSEVRSTQPS